MNALRYVLENLFGRAPTRRYPFEKRTPIPGSRGHLVNDPDKCVYCSLCAKRCPANALAVTRKPDTWTLDPYRCVLCGYCVEVCPKKSLSMNSDHQRAST